MDGLGEQIHIRTLGAVHLGLSVGIEENIDVVATDGPTFVFSNVNYSIDQKLAAIRNDPWINGNRMIGGCHSARGSVAAPSFGAGAAWAVGSGFKGTQVSGLSTSSETGNGRWHLAVGPGQVVEGAGQHNAACGYLDLIFGIFQGRPVNGDGKAVFSIALAVGFQIGPVLVSGNRRREDYRLIGDLHNG